MIFKNNRRGIWEAAAPVVFHIIIRPAEQETGRNMTQRDGRNREMEGWRKYGMLTF